MGRSVLEVLPNSLEYKSNDSNALHLLCSDTSSMPQIDLGKEYKVFCCLRGQMGECGVKSCTDGMHIWFFSLSPPVNLQSKEPHPHLHHRKQTLDSQWPFWMWVLVVWMWSVIPVGHSQVFSGTSCWPAQLLLSWLSKKDTMVLPFAGIQNMSPHKYCSGVILWALSPQKH